MPDYKPRIADKLLRERLESAGAVLIEGQKWCGKTTTAEQGAGSVVYMDDPALWPQNMMMTQIGLSELLKGATPRLIDEWQIAPRIWDAVRFTVDRRGEPGQFILTGSAVPPDKSEIHHTGTGRFSWLRMRTMSLFESLDSTGDVSLSALFDNPTDVKGKSDIDLRRLAFLTCRGGWPAAIDIDENKALRYAIDYYEAVVRYDLARADGVGRDEGRIRRLMRTLARNQGTQARISLLRGDMAANDAMTLSEETVRSYMAALSHIFVTEDMPAWCPCLRSKSAVRTSDTRYFSDPSIATAALGLYPDSLIGSLDTFGLIFETLCARDLRVYAEPLRGIVYHFRDRTGLECDAVVCLPDGSYGLFEIKLGGDKAIEDGAATLLKLAGKIDTDKMRAPSFIAVLIGVGAYAYMREDGVCVVPIGCLRD